MTSERGPFTYFQGALQPDHVDDEGMIVYKYVGLKREHLDPKFWRV